MYFVLWFSISISKEKPIPVKKSPTKIFMKIFPRLLSLRKWFCNNKKILNKMINQNIGNLYFVLWFLIIINKDKTHSTKKIPSKIFMKIFWENDFARIKNFRPKLLMKILENCTLYYDFRSVFLKRNLFQWKISIKNFMKILPRLLSLRKWFCKNKKFSTKIINKNIGKLFFVLWFSISICKEKPIPMKKSPSKIFMKIFPR